MTDCGKKYGKPTAKKVSGCEWYMPAITTEFGPDPLPNLGKYETRYKATAKAKRVLKAMARLEGFER